MPENDPLSPLLRGIADVFVFHAAQGARYLLVYWRPWSDALDYESVAKGRFPWDVHDDFVANGRVNDPGSLVMALDLQQSFMAQVPEHMKGFERLESFVLRPLITIPGRDGIVPPSPWSKETARALRGAHLQLVS